ncbi:MAG TPA: hypothetical protein VJG67_02485 [Candidatus Paceibacterota bacterium]
MSIANLLEKVKSFYWLILGLVLASVFFALGRISAFEERHTPIKIEYQNVSETASLAKAVSFASSTSGVVIGSKSGKKYYYPWCGTLKRVKPENQVPFASIEAARSAGYTPAANCKGLK